MKLTLQIGIATVMLALTCYSTAILTARRRRLVTARVRLFLTLGVVFDITATALMIAGSTREWDTITLHAALGYSSLTGMLTDMILMWRHHLQQPETTVPRWLHLYSQAAYAWWVIAFITGGALVVTGNT